MYYGIFQSKASIPASSINITDCHNITEILLKVAFNTITHPSILYKNKGKWHIIDS
jgi:hypothetical protein